MPCGFKQVEKENNWQNLYLFKKVNRRYLSPSYSDKGLQRTLWNGHVTL